MRRVLPTILIVLIGMSVAIALRREFKPMPAQPLSVPTGDIEIAWIHTTTNMQTWERFVAGIHQAVRQSAGLEIDDSRAFLDQSAAIPEVVVSLKDTSSKLRIRWYKLSSEVNLRDWVNSLAKRDPPPIAFMGGGSSDRAIDLAQALNERTDWKGERPLLFITTATANEVYNEETAKNENLVDFYKGRTFRFCFTDDAMAKAVVDFVWQSDDLRPRGPVVPSAMLSLLGATSNWNTVSVAAAIRQETMARAYVLAWEDDPYSVDLAEHFHRLFHENDNSRLERASAELRKIPYSVGTLNYVNPRETGIAEEILAEPLSPGQRILLVVPASTNPARRILRAFATDTPLIGKNMVAVTGDGISVNTIYRDGDIAWPIRELSIPLVIFTHQNPVAWDPEVGPADTRALRPPNSTDDVLLFADMGKVLADTILRSKKILTAKTLAEELRNLNPAFFDPEGNRLAGKGEYVMVAKPHFGFGDRLAPSTVFEVYTRSNGHQWDLVKRLIK